MHSPHIHTTSNASEADDGPLASERTSIEEEQFDRLAQLVADGQVPFPGDLSDPDAERLCHEVSRRRRRRLVRYVARSIALDLVQTDGP